MELKKLFNYLTPLLLGILIFSSNFLNTGIFNFGDNNFAVWFILSIFCFVCGWLIGKTLNWHFGGKVVFAVIISVIFISVLMISFFREYFSANELLTENLILYSLRSIMLGAMAFFGMSVVEVFSLQRELNANKEKIIFYEQKLTDANKEAELELREAKLKADRILLDAQSVAKNMILKKERIEKELKEYIQAERELIKKYENI
jgi:hypothetical protein